MNDYLSSLFSLDGRTAVVTGGSSGIGRGIATALARAGAATVIVARGAARIDETVRELEESGCRAAGVVGDLSTRDGIHAVADAAAEPFGEPDILVNSAGINIRPPYSAITEDDWDATMTVNALAPFLLGQRYAATMAARGYGRLIHISSQQAHRAFVGSGIYGASKGALESLMRSEAEAWGGTGVTSNTLVPGFVLTPLNARLQTDPEKVAALAARTMIGRNGLPSDFAGAAVFLAGAGSSYITGLSLFVDGGLSVH
ncbi:MULTISPECIES: SDR family NAD(P)-dependent oxidoreductase [unclassified Microbacterium]|uniref:SDR family NAD(P)-dependent oxidoreductase n=1 Tax=unclassified Microbacterium TaxID=2609290 RepID=UPI000EAAB3FC|nr:MULTISPECIES: SDR family oxidoreductase [unclassified Microbacterium]MBT2485304.1 SDR family oxidoreductase [Microbacterium sp. ISL-108]RKN68114.1 SDR family oxidoreductase [Microbacterium sp. CGR2]